MVAATASALEELLQRITEGEEGLHDPAAVSALVAEIHKLLQGVPSEDVEDIRNRAILAAALERACRRLGVTGQPGETGD